MTLLFLCSKPLMISPLLLKWSGKYLILTKNTTNFELPLTSPARFHITSSLHSYIPVARTISEFLTWTKLILTLGLKTGASFLQEGCLLDQFLPMFLGVVGWENLSGMPEIPGSNVLVKLSISLFWFLLQLHLILLHRKHTMNICRETDKKD